VPAAAIASGARRRTTKTEPQAEPEAQHFSPLGVIIVSISIFLRFRSALAKGYAYLPSMAPTSSYVCGGAFRTPSRVLVWFSTAIPTLPAWPINLLNYAIETIAADNDGVAVVTTAHPSGDLDCASNQRLQDVLASLAKTFAQPFALVNVESGDLVYSDHEGLSCDFYDRIELLAAVSRSGKPEIVEDVAPLNMLAIPLRKLGVGANLVAVGIFVNQQVHSEAEIATAARTFGIDDERALRWSASRALWQPSVLQQVAETVLENLVQRAQLTRLQSEIKEAEAHAEDVYDELELLHRLTRYLHLSESEPELWQGALNWLAKTIPAQCLAIVFSEEPENESCDANLNMHQVITEGECPVEKNELCELIRRFAPTAQRQPVLLNRAETALPTWYCPTIRELVCVPIECGDQPRSWLLALNYRGVSETEFGEFGSVEIRLLSSVGTILGIHSSNIGLYRQQSELFASSVQALTSAIDAKDGYTAGHSDRVALFSRSLAEQLGLSKTDRDTIYLAGLLHDIGKIGIDDQVLNKPGQLTSEEFEQIKLHPQLGYEILNGVRQLDKVLPIVLHHHEAWDGSGYPHGLKKTDTPRMARIMAVADAFDAMSSDRPYRKGMPIDKVHNILRSGAGSQWDPEVVDAFFEIHEDIQRIAKDCNYKTSLELDQPVS